MFYAILPEGEPLHYLDRISRGSLRIVTQLDDYLEAPFDGESILRKDEEGLIEPSKSTRVRGDTLRILSLPEMRFYFSFFKW